MIDTATEVTAEVDETEQAARQVHLARARLRIIRHRFIRREAGASDVAAAEHELSRALERLDDCGPW